MAKVGIVMGSDSDMPIMSQAAAVLEQFGIDFEMTIISAHREPDIFFEWAKGAEARGTKVIIAGAGMAAHLPGMCAAIFPMPVIGIPMHTTSLGGRDSLYSIVQMPTGIPVATVAINGGANAGILAAKILATGASVVAGTMVSELIAKTAVGTIPVVGTIVQTFCGTLVAGIMSCSLLYMLDNNKAINWIVSILNRIPSVDKVVMYYREQAILLEKYSADLFSIDLETFKKEIETIHTAVKSLSTDLTPDALNMCLLNIYTQLGLELPWKALPYNSEDDFWTDREGSWGFS